MRVVAASSTRKENENIHVKCITFSQPPVGNAALREYVFGVLIKHMAGLSKIILIFFSLFWFVSFCSYVHEKGWHHFFKSYCIPEDLVPRILSPAYFHHYNEQRMSTAGETEATDSSLSKKNSQGVTSDKSKGKEHEQLVIGVGPVQNSFWRLSRLVPLEAVKKQLDRYRGKKVDPAETSTAPIQDVVIEPQSLEIEEGRDGISLKPLQDTGNGQTVSGRSEGKTDSSNGFGNTWGRVPSLPSYVPFGQVDVITLSINVISFRITIVLNLLEFVSNMPRSAMIILVICQ